MTDYEEVLPRVCKEKLSGIILKPERNEVIISPLNGKDVLSCYQLVLVKSYLPKLCLCLRTKPTNCIHHFHIPHNTPCLPPKIYITFVFHFPWVLQSSQEKRKTMLMQNFGRQTRCIMGDVILVPRASVSFGHVVGETEGSKLLTSGDTCVILTN